MIIQSDDNGNTAIRIVDAAPFAFDEFENAIRVKIISKDEQDIKKSNTKLFKQTHIINPGVEKTFVATLNMSGYPRFYLTIRGNAPHDVIVRRRNDDLDYVDDPQIISSNKHHTTEYMDTKAQILRIDIKNKSEQEHEFTIILMGVL